MLPKPHLTSHFKVSGSEWETTPSWLSESLRSVLYSSSVYSFHLFWSFLLLLGLYCFCPLMCPSLDEMILWYSQFSWGDLLSYPFCCLPLFLCIFLWRRPSCLAILWNSAFSWVSLSLSPLLFPSLLSSAICKVSSDNHFAFLHFFCWGDGFVCCLLYDITDLCP